MHKRVLSQVYYIRQRRSFTATGQRSHSFPPSAASSGMCGCVRDRSAAISPVLRIISVRSRFALGRLQASYLLPWVLIAITDSLDGAKELERGGGCERRLLERGPCFCVNTGVCVTLDIDAYRHVCSPSGCLTMSKLSSRRQLAPTDSLRLSNSAHIVQLHPPYLSITSWSRSHLSLLVQSALVSQ